MILKFVERVGVFEVMGRCVDKYVQTDDEKEPYESERKRNKQGMIWEYSSMLVKKPKRTVDADGRFQGWSHDREALEAHDIHTQ